MDRLKKERQTLESAATKLLSLAVKGGAETAEVCASYGVTTKINLEKQDFHLASSDDGYNLGLRVLAQGRQGFSYCNSIEPKDLKDEAMKAVEIARFSPENPHNSMGPSDNIPKEAPASLWDNALYDLSLKTQKDWTKIMADEATRDPRFRLNDGSLAISATLFLISNSQGTHKLERETALSWTVMGMAVEGSNITSFDYFQRLSRTAEGVADKILSTTKKFREYLIGNLKSGPAQSYKGVVVFSPRAVLDILVDGLIYHINGRSVVEGTSRWKLDTLSKQVLSDQFSLKDSPWLTDRFGCTVFDREGVPTRTMSLIEKGVLRGFLLDQYAAKALERSSSGHAVGGPSTVPTVGPHSLCVQPGSEPLSALLRRTTESRKEFLMVHRFSGQVDPVTGDFSGVAKGGEWWHGGERAHYVKETLISGNLFEALGSGLYGVSLETEVVDDAAESPTLVVDNVSVTYSGT